MSKRKALGQHFLSNRKVLGRIIKAIDPQEEDRIIEIGAGRGILTYPLAERAGQVVSIETDSVLLPALQEKESSRLSIIHADVLTVQFHEIFPDSPVKIVGNLPYSISSPILFKVLSEQDLFSLCVFLIQKEVAERLCAGPGTKKYAPLSILFHNYFQSRMRFIVPPSAFSPPPRVDSALVSLHKRETPLVSIEDRTGFQKFLRYVFRHRRKMLRNNLKSMNVPLSKLESAFDRAEIPQKARPEEVSLEQFTSLFDSIHSP
ncbi:16S rRNA (adenine(1518)-N(6)/adenine(1519)-N(6))-dimethyltransferase RsmA [Acidobacteriota bacterium]